jgi:hypothetical protein
MKNFLKISLRIFEGFLITLGFLIVFLLLNGIWNSYGNRIKFPNEYSIYPFADDLAFYKKNDIVLLFDSAELARTENIVYGYCTKWNDTYKNNFADRWSNAYFIINTFTDKIEEFSKKEEWENELRKKGITNFELSSLQMYKLFDDYDLD